MDSLKLIDKYFPDLSSEQREKIAQLGPLYEDWNAKINVISRKDMDSFFEKHVLHSLGIAKVHTFQPGETVLDVGTGGGFPGIPLAIIFPETHFHLVDSIGKKIKVVEEVARALNLQNITATKARAEDLPNTYDYIVSRAVTRMARFHSWIADKYRQGVLYLKGGDLGEEMAELGLPYTISKLSDHYKEPFFETKAVVQILVDRSG